MKAQTQTSSPSTLEAEVDRRLITTDCHIATPHRLVDELPESYRQYFPRLVERADGDYLVMPSTQRRSALMRGDAGQGMKLPEGSEARVAWGNVCGEADPSFDAATMVAELESDGVHGAVLIGRLDGYGPDVPLDAEIAYCQLVNDWLADSFRPYLDRYAPGIHLPWRDVTATVKELERAAGLGLRPALLPDGIFDRPYHREEWEPLWEAASGLGIPLTMHVSSQRIPEQAAQAMLVDAYPGRAIVGFYKQSVDQGETVGWLVFSGMLQKYPDLQVVMTEGYAAWLSFAMQFYDHHWGDSRFAAISKLGDGGNAVTLDAPPSHYIKRQIHATFMWDPIAIRERDVTGLDCLMWGNDYPHHEGSFAFSQEWVDKQFAGVPEHEIDQIVRGNAAKVFNINV
jgi:predicted TIM-barrel fold metal-dependent hydrolase